MTAFFSKKFLIISFVLCMFAVSKRIGSVVRTGIERNMSSNKILDMNGLLLDWYEQNRRDLPWRNTQDPYLIWVSEIILQQTRVAQGLDYFVRFTNRFPDVAALASASEEEVLKYWQGLGYYSRARNLQKAARQIMEEFGAVNACNLDGGGSSGMWYGDGYVIHTLCVIGIRPVPTAFLVR